MTRLRPSILRWAAAGLYHSGLIRPLSLAVGHAGRTPAFPILAYHRVNDEGDPFFPSVPTGVFERHMAYIARTFHVLTVEELAERMGRDDLPKNSLAISFDDGYRDNLTHAAPILARYGLPATLFLASGFVGTSQVPWHDRLAHALKTTKCRSVMAPWGETLILDSQTDRLRALDRTLARFKRMPDDDMRRTLDRLLELLGGAQGDYLRGFMLSWADVQALAARGFSIGAHTVNHPILSRVEPEVAWKEIVGSKGMIESACGKPPRAFAYPNGGPEDYTEAVKGMVREAGFACAVTTRFGTNTRATCPYALRRGGPWEEHLPTYALKLAWYRRASG